MTAKIINRWIMILITAALMLLTVLDWQLSPVRVLFAVALVTILPGYALTTAIFINTPLGILEKIAFSCGFSLGMVALGGLILNYTRWGIQSISWIILLGGVALLSSVIAIARMKNEEEVDLQVVQVPLRVRQILLMTAAVAAFAGVYLLARAGAISQSLPPTTRLWILWADQAHTQVAVGLQNQEQTEVQYSLQLSTLQGNFQVWSPITLRAGNVWQGTVDTPLNAAESDVIKATLYRLDNPGIVYREVYLRRVVEQKK